METANQLGKGDIFLCGEYRRMELRYLKIKGDPAAANNTRTKRENPFVLPHNGLSLFDFQPYKDLIHPRFSESSPRSRDAYDAHPKKEDGCWLRSHCGPLFVAIVGVGVVKNVGSTLSSE